jgi:hypothetical protein
MGKTVVVFRRWPDGSIIALFPNEPFTHSRSTCMSYMHVGQHGEADYHYVVKVTKLASEAEQRPLRQELENIGYDLKVVTRKPK